MQPQLVLNPDEQIPHLLERIVRLRNDTRNAQRVLIAIAGGPGSGKSTLCTTLLQRGHEYGVHDMIAVPMDGFHHPKSHLATLPNPTEAFARRGAPFTFDAQRFVAAVAKLKSGSSTDEIALPGFDHAVKDPVEDEIVVKTDTKVVLLEGNYVLLDEKPWDAIAEMVDEKWYIDVSRETAKARLVERHLRTGIETCPLAAAARAEGNDLRNADYIASRLSEPDVVIRSC